jgi:hypothetical protein
MCRLDRIDEFSDEQSFTALRTVADHVAGQLRFVESVFASDAEEPIDFVADLAEAGFPAASEVPLWFCPSWENRSGRHQGYDWLYADAMNSEGAWNLDPGANDREVLIGFPGTSHLVTVLRDTDYNRPFCIEQITESS